MERNTRILLVQLYANGDCLYATSVARQIKHDYPDCHLTWMIAGFCSGIIDLNPYVDEKRITNEVPKNNVAAFRKLKRQLRQEKKEGMWDEVFITHNMDSNQALYDGTIRGMIFRAYPKPITVPLQPVMVLSETEKENVRQFALLHRLQEYRHVLLWEFAPQSGQSVLDFAMVKRAAEKLSRIPGTCIILSSAHSFESTPGVIDGSVLSIRENAALTHYCHLLIGCSSGITWLSTSTAAKSLPMLQLLDPMAYFRNAPSVDFERYGFSQEGLIELMHFDEEKIVNAVQLILDKGIAAARVSLNEKLPVQFNTTRKVVYNMLCYMQFRAIARHYRITTSIYGRHPLFIREFILAILSFPFNLLRNKWKKRKR